MRGMTLLELLISLAIIGILAGISYPTYVTQMSQARRSDAITTLLGFQLELERQRSLKGSFLTIGQSMVISPSEYYRFEITNLGTNTYKLTAIAINNQQHAEKCPQISINHLSEKLPKNCW
ncbi:MAG: hypothetical protein COA51_05365 [Idiomarina sp.]|nr:MAG: hypothetical protein COA51_05365 [Idiomarina sp.]